MYDTYEVIQPNRDEATEWTGPKLEATHVTLTFDLLTRKRGTTHRDSMGCVCISNEVIRSNRDGPTERTWEIFERPV